MHVGKGLLWPRWLFLRALGLDGAVVLAHFPEKIGEYSSFRGDHALRTPRTSRTASVTYDPTEASPQELVEAIRHTGYGADLPVDRSVLEEQEASDRAYATEYRELALKAGIVAIIQPGGSVRDEEVLAAVDAAGAAMVATDRRHFRH